MSDDIKKKHPAGYHPNSLANLSTPEKGEIRNPNGRPKGRTLKKTLLDLLDGRPLSSETREIPSIHLRAYEEQLGRPITRRDLVTLRMIQKAYQEGDVAAFSAIADRTEGKPIQINKNENTTTNYVDFLKNIPEEEEDND